jgi:hypothetical protein
MQAQIDLARSENDYNAMRSEMVNVNVLLDGLNKRQNSQGSLTDAERHQFFDLGAQLEELKNRRSAAQEKANHVRSDLDHNVCATH